MSYSAASEAKINLRFESDTDGIERTKKSWQGLTTALKDTTNLDSAKSAIDNTIYSVENLGNSFVNTAATLGNTPLSIENRLTGITTGFEKLEDVAGNRIAKKVFPDLIEQLSGFTAKGDPLYKLVGDLNEETTNFDKSLVLVSKSSKGLLVGIDKLQAGVGSLEKSFNALGIQSEFVSAGFSKVKLALGVSENLVQLADISYKTREAFEDFQATFSEFATAIAPVGSALAVVAKETVNLDAPLQDLTTIFGTTEAAAKLFGNTTLAAFAKLGFQATVITNIAIGLGKVGDAVDQLMKQWNELYRGFETMQTLGVDTTFAELATSLGATGEKILFNVQATKQLISTATQAYTQLEESVAYVRTLSSGAEYSVPELTASLQDLANNGVGNAIKSGELAISVYNNLSAGIGAAAGKIGEALEVSATAAKYSSATSGNLDDIQKALNFTSQAYGRSAAESAKTMELLDKIVQQGVTNSQELGANIGGLAATAASTGNSIESTFAATALATRTLGADAYTAIQRLYTSLSSMAPQSKKALDELGFTINAEVLKTKDMTTLMQELYNAAGGNVEKLQEIIPESLAFRGALSLMTTSVSDAQTVISDFGNVTGNAVDEMFDRSQQTIAKRSQALANGFQEVFANAGQKIVNSGFFDAGLSAVEGLLDRFKNLPEPIQNAIGAIMMFNMGLEKAMGVIGALVGILGSLAAVSGTIIGFYRGGAFLSGLTKGFQSAGEGANLLTKGLSAIQGGLKEAIGLSVKLTDKGFRPVLDANNEFVKSTEGVRNSISNSFNNVKEKVDKVTASFGKSFDTLKDGSKTVTKAVGETLSTTGKVFADVSKNLSGVYEGLNTTTLTNFANVVKSSVATVTGSVESISKGSNIAISKAFENARYQATLGTKYYSDLNPEVAKYIGLNLKQLPVIQNVTNAFDKFKNSISSTITTTKNFFGNFKSLDMLKDSVLDTTENLTKNFKGIGNKLKDVLTTDLKSINFKELFSNIQFNPKNILDGLKKIPEQLQYNLKYAQSYGKYFTKLLETDIKGLVPKIDVNKFKEEAVIATSNVVSTIQNKFKDLKITNFDGILNGLQQGLSKVLDVDLAKFPNKLSNNFNNLTNSIGKSFSSLTTNAKQLSNNITNALSIKLKAPNFVEALTDNFNKLNNKAKEVFSNITKTVNDLSNKFTSSKLFTNFSNQLTELNSKTKSTFTNLSSSLTNSFKGINIKPLTDSFSNVGKIVSANFNIATSSIGAFSNSLTDSFAKTKVGSTLIPILSGTMKGLSGTFALAGNAAKLMWTSILAPALPIIALVTALGVIRDFIPAFGSVTEAGDKFAKSTYEIGKATKSSGKELDSLIQKNKELKGEATAQLDSFSAKALDIVGNVINGLQKLVSFLLDKMSFGLLKPFTKMLDGLGDIAQKSLKGLANDVEANFDAKAVTQMNKEIGETSLYVAKLKKEIKGFNENNVLPIDVLKEETTKARKYYLEFATEAQKTIDSLGNSEKDEVLKKQIEAQVKATKESYEKIAAITKENEDIVAKATLEKRTLTAAEIQKLNEGETAAFASKKETITQEIALLNTRYEEAKKIDAASAEGYKKQIDALNEQVTALDNTAKKLQERRKVLNDFTNEINKNITDIGEVGKGATKEFEEMTAALDKNASKSTGARKQALEDTSTQVKSFEQNINDIENYAEKIKNTQGKITNFQTQTLNSLLSNTKAIGLQLDDALNDSFEPSEFQGRIQSWLEVSQEAMEEFQDPELVKNTIKQIEETQVTFIDATGQTIKTTLDKTLTKEQLREFINLKLAVIDKELENKVSDIEDKKKDLQDALDLGTIDSSTSIEGTNKLNSELREVQQKSSEDKLTLIEKEFGKESKEYKDHFKTLKELQVQHKKDIIKEQEDLLTARYNKQQQAFNKEKAIAEKALNDGSTDKELEDIDALNVKETELRVANLKEQLELNKGNAEKRLEIEQELLEATSELDKKRRDSKQNSLDRELEAATNKLDKEKQLLEKSTIKGSTDSDLDKVAALEEKELKLRAEYIQKQLATKQKGSKEAIALEEELAGVLTTIEKNRFEQSQKLLDRKYEKQNDALIKEKRLANKATRDGTTNEELDKLDALNNKELQLDITKLKEKASLYKAGSKERLAIEKELAAKIDALEEATVNQAKNRRKRVLDDKLAKIDLENVQLEKALYEGSKTREQLEDGQNANTKKQSLERQKYLQGELKVLQKGSKEYVETLKQLGQEQVNYQKAVINEQVVALNRSLEKQKNSIQANINELTKYTNNYDNLIKSLEIEKSIRESNNNFIKETNNLDISSMELRLKTVGDIVQKAELQYEITKKQNSIKAQELDTELNNLEVQNEVNKATREREKIQQNLNKLELERNILTTTNQITVAKLNKESSNTITALELQLDSLNEQNRMLGANNQLTDKQAIADDKNLENQKKLILRRKELNTESANIDEALAKQQIEIALYDKQLQQLNIKNKVLENSATSQTALNDRLTKAYERQANILNTQKSVLEGLRGATESTLQLAMAGAKTDEQKEALQQQYNAVRLQILDKQQKADLALLDMQTKQNKLALQRQEIENNIAKTKQTALILEAEIEEKKVLARKDATEEEKQLAALNVSAAQQSLVALEEQSKFLEQQKKDQEYIDKLNRNTKVREQEVAVLQERSNIAATTKDTTDDALVANDAYTSFTKNLKKINDFTDKFKPTVEEPTANEIKPFKKIELDTKDLKVTVPKIEIKQDKISTIETKQASTTQQPKIEIVVNAKAEFTGTMDKSVIPDLKKEWNNQANTIAIEVQRRLPKR
jgi:hypothetical protein